MEDFSMGLLTVNGIIPKGDYSFNTKHTRFGDCLRKIQSELKDELEVISDCIIAVNTVERPQSGFYTISKTGKYILIEIYEHEGMTDYYCYFKEFDEDNMPNAGKFNLSGNQSVILITAMRNTTANENEQVAEALLKSIESKLTV